MDGTKVPSRDPGDKSAMGDSRESSESLSRRCALEGRIDQGFLDGRWAESQSEAASVFVLLSDVKARDGLRLLFLLHDRYRIKGEAGTVAEALTKHDLHDFDYILWELSAEGIDGLRLLRKRGCKAHIAVLFAGQPDLELLLEAVDLGVRVCSSLDKLAEVLCALKAFESNSSYLSPECGWELLQKAVLSTVSPREKVVLVAWAEGKKAGEIAEELSLPLGSIKGEVRRLYEKLGVTSRADAARVGKELGLIGEPAPKVGR